MALRLKPSVSFGTFLRSKRSNAIWLNRTKYLAALHEPTPNASIPIVPLFIINRLHSIVMQMAISNLQHSRTLATTVHTEFACSRLLFHRAKKSIFSLFCGKLWATSTWPNFAYSGRRFLEQSLVSARYYYCQAVHSFSSQFNNFFSFI